MHERLNSYADFLEQPHVKESGLIQWLAQAGLDRPVPVPALPGMLPQIDGTPRGTAPVTGQHTAGNPGRARLRQRRDRRAARPGRRRRRMITRLDPSQYRRTPWKNGGGVTVDIAEQDDVWRFGRTPITTPGPFSDYAGFDRLQVLVAGHGLVLETPDGEIDVRTPFKPVRFAGETPIVSRLEVGTGRGREPDRRPRQGAHRPARCCRPTARSTVERRHAPCLCRRWRRGARRSTARRIGWQPIMPCGSRCRARRSSPASAACFCWGASYAYSGGGRRRRRRRIRRGAGQGRRGRHLHRARRASRGDEEQGPEDRRRARRDPSRADPGDRRSQDRRPGRFRAVLRQAVGRRERRRAHQAAGRARTPR